MCGCRKAYLSYPALYTHVKNKHDGVFPIGSNAKRKIPKNFEEEADNVFIPNLDKFYNELSDFVMQTDGAAAFSKQPITRDSIDRVLDSAFLSNLIEVPALQAGIKIVSNVQDDPEHFESLKDSMSIYQILGYYLLSVSKYCSDDFFKEYLYLVIMIAISLNSKGEMFIEKEESRSAKVRDGKEKIFCESQNIHVVSEILNLFIAELFPNLLRSFQANSVGFEFLGFEDEQIKNLIIMTKLLANWLFNNEFTDYRLEINVDL